MSELLDYGSLQLLASALGRSVNTLLALGFNNDPFYAGRPARRERAEWFAALWRS